MAKINLPDIKPLNPSDPFLSTDEKATREVGELLNDLREAREIIEGMLHWRPDAKTAQERAREFLDRTPEVKL